MRAPAAVSGKAGSSGKTAADPPEADAGQDDGESGEDQRLVPLQWPVAAQRLVRDHIPDSEPVDAFLDGRVEARRYSAAECAASGELVRARAGHALQADRPV